MEENSSSEVMTDDSPETATQSVVASPDAQKQAEANHFTVSPETLAASSEFIGKWNELVSTTNWDKGRVIAEWREALEKKNAPITERSDEAWVQLVGYVTSQHVGRLRRVYQRFGSLRDEYQGLYWSHFQTSLDWEDAEMWLEGAIQNRWSVAKMRAARWEAVGAPDGVKPEDEEILEGEIDGEAYDAISDPTVETAPGNADLESKSEKSQSDSDDGSDHDESELSDSCNEDSVKAEAAARIRPFENLADLPEDVADAFEQFKLVILSHKLTGWEQISRTDMVASLDSLKALALAPNDEGN